MKKLFLMLLMGVFLYSFFEGGFGNQFRWRFHGVGDCNLTVVDASNAHHQHFIKRVMKGIVCKFKNFIPGMDSDCKSEINTTLPTQIVNKPFDISLMCMNKRGHLIPFHKGMVVLELVEDTGNECENEKVLMSNEFFFFDGMPFCKSRFFTLNYDKAVKRVKFRIKYPTKDFEFNFNFNFQGCIDTISGFTDMGEDEFIGKVEECINNLDAEFDANSAYVECKNRCEAHFRHHFNIDCAANPQDVRCQTRWQNRHRLSCIMNCAFKTNLDGIKCSDSFAIRPNRFEFSVPQIVKKAGEEFNITVFALDFVNKPTIDYNETISVNEGDSPVISAKDKKSEAFSALLSGKNLKFINGEANITLTYPEVGEVEIKIEEKNSPFAEVDINDEDDNRLLIESAVLNLISKVDKLKVDANYTNFKDYDFTYLSNDLSLYSKLNLTIKALSAKDTILKNFSNNLYASGGTLKVKLNLDKLVATKILYKENNVTKIEPLRDEIEVVITPELFKNGVANIIVPINFDKNYTNPVNAANVNIKEIKYNPLITSVIESSEIDANLEKNKATFLYARLAVENVVGYGKSVEENVSVMYLKDNRWVVNTSHSDDVGKIKEIIFSAEEAPKITYSITPLNNGYAKVEFNSTTTPFRAKAHYDIDSWLWYHPLARGYLKPSLTNLDCTTHPCSTVTFLNSVKESGSSEKEGWAGVGNESQKYSEENKTIRYDLNDVNSSKEEVRRVY